MTFALMLAFAVAPVPGSLPPSPTVSALLQCAPTSYGGCCWAGGGVYQPPDAPYDWNPLRPIPPTEPQSTSPGHNRVTLFDWKGVIKGINSGIKRAVPAQPDDPSHFAHSEWSLVPQDTAVFGVKVGTPDTTSGAFVPPPREASRPAFDLQEPVVEDEHLFPCFRRCGMRLNLLPSYGWHRGERISIHF
jgi:hypothetical protein